MSVRSHKDLDMGLLTYPCHGAEGSVSAELDQPEGGPCPLPRGGGSLGRRGLKSFSHLLLWLGKLLPEGTRLQGKSIRPAEMLARTEIIVSLRKGWVRPAEMLRRTEVRESLRKGWLSPEALTS